MNVATWSDEEGDEMDQNDGDVSGNFVAFFSHGIYLSEYDDEDYVSSDDFEERHIHLEEEYEKLVAN